MKGNFSDVWQAVADALPDRTAIRTPDGQVWSYRRITRQAGSLAQSLSANGILPGDPIAILLHNRPEFLVTLFACLASGITPVPLNFRLRANEIAALLDDSGAKALVYPTSLAPIVTEAAELAEGDLLLVRIVDEDTADALGLLWDDLVAGEAPLPPHAPDGGEMWIYTGGTTGRPKAARWSVPEMFEAQLVPAYALAGLPLPKDMQDAVRIASDPDRPPMVNLPLAPFVHGTALTTSMNTLLLGGTVLVTSSAKLDADEAVRFARESGATRLIVAGDAVAIPVVEAAERAGVRLDTVTSVLSSGMRFSPETKRRVHQLSHAIIHDMLASTEGGAFAVTTTASTGDLPGRPQLLPTAAVLDADYNEIQDRVGALGILAQRGGLPLGYHRDAEKTEATFPVIAGIRYVVPGDWVRVLEDRYIEFLGRGSSVVNTGGEKVYPQEVEEALLTHPAVADAVVIGTPDDRFGEIVTAVVERSDPRVTEEEIIAHAATLLAGYKKPRHILFRESLERTPTGKIDLNHLRREIQRDRKRRKP